LITPVYCQDPIFQRQFFLQLQQELSFHSPKDWYQISTAHFFSRPHGRRILALFNDSPSQFVQSQFPNHSFKMWKFLHIPFSLQRKQSFLPMAREFLLYIASQRNLESMDEYYNLQAEHLRQHDGHFFLRRCSNSPSMLLLSAWIEFHWQLWKFKTIPLKMWKKRENREMYFEWLRDHFNISHPDDWYDISLKQISQLYGEALIKSEYRGSILAFLCDMMPQHHWLPWRFRKSPKNFWREARNCRMYLDWFFVHSKHEHKNLSTPLDLYHLTFEDLVTQKGSGILTYHSTISSFLISIFPELPLCVEAFSGRNTQYRLHEIILHALPRILAQYNATIPCFNKSEKEEEKVWIELDIYLEEMAIGMEYQGHQHYSSIAAFSISDYEKRDGWKRNICNQMGITLISVPYWFGMTKKSLYSFLVDCMGECRADVTLDTLKI